MLLMIKLLIKRFSNAAAGIVRLAAPTISIVPTVTLTTPELFMLPAICVLPVTVIERLFWIVMSLQATVLIIVGYVVKPVVRVILLALIGKPPKARFPTLFQLLSSAPVNVPTIPIKIVVLLIYYRQLPMAAIV